MNMLRAAVLALASTSAGASQMGYFGVPTEPGSYSYEFNGVSRACTMTLPAGPVQSPQEYTYNCAGIFGPTTPYQPPNANPGNPLLQDMRIKFVNTGVDPSHPEYTRYYIHCQQVQQIPVPPAVISVPGYICIERVGMRGNFEGITP